MPPRANETSARVVARFDAKPDEPVSSWLRDLPTADADADYLLLIDADGISLRETRSRRAHPLRVDFASADARRRRLAGGQLLHRAIGLRQGRRPHVIDATAGLGADAFLLAAAGCRLTLLERHPVIAALLWDGLRRAASGGGELAKIAERMQLQAADAHQALETLAAPVVYLDPMFPLSGKNAMNRKQMRWLSALTGADADAETLLSKAERAATDRVVVKRRRLATPLAQRKPDHQIKGSSTRFDVHLIR